MLLEGMSRDDAKRRAARAALDLVDAGSLVGVGTGSTVAFFVEALAERHIAAAVSSSERTTTMLRERGIEVVDLNAVTDLPLYVDGADECDPERRLIKGGGGALTREKILAAAARTFACIIDPQKRVSALGRFPLPIEVIPMARAFVARRIAALGGRPVWREGFVTDNGGHIIDVHGLDLTDPVARERELDQIAGVITVGLFALRPADVVITGEAR